MADREYIPDGLEDADSSMARDIIYIVHSKPDDNNFKDTVYRTHSEWALKLRGNKLGPSYIHGGKNTGSWFRGYIYSPEPENRTALEQLLLFDILQGSITVEKINLDEYRAKLQSEQDEHFNTLFTVG